MENIETLIKLFRQLGGTFDNAEIRYSKESGFYCHTLDPNQESHILCPADLLVEADDLDVNNNGLFISTKKKYGNKIDFLNKYFAFQFNESVLRFHTETKRQINTLSDKDLSLISTILPPELYKLKKYKGLTYEKERMIDTHKIIHCGKTVIMPFVTFLNYHKNGQPYNVEDDAISVKGKFNDEVSAKYNNNDTLMIAGSYGFITNTKFAYSMPVSYSMPDGTRIIINRCPDEATHIGNNRWKPLVEKKSGAIIISWFPLHLENAPRYPAIIAGIIASETNLSAEKLLLDIISLNLHALVPVAFQLKKSKNQFSQHMSNVAQRQLELIAGTRP